MVVLQARVELESHSVAPRHWAVKAKTDRKRVLLPPGGHFLRQNDCALTVAVTRDGPQPLCSAFCSQTYVTHAHFITVDFTGYVIHSGDFHCTLISCQRLKEQSLSWKASSYSPTQRSSAFSGTRSIITAFTRARHLCKINQHQCLPTSVVVFPQVFFHGIFHSILFRCNHVIMGVRCGVVGWGTALQVGRSRVRFPMVSLEFYIDIILPAALRPCGRLSL